MTLSKKSLASTLVLTVFLSMWLTIGCVPIGSAQSGTNIIGILTSSATWTPSGSPYTLSGPTAVNTGVTLTIQPGVTVNLNGYYIQVNGTLTATGSASSKIQFIDGLLRFTPVSNGWNENAGTGCIIAYSTLSSTSISASNALKLDQDTISGSVTVGDSSVITNDNTGSITVGNLATLTSNQISGSVTAGSSCTFTDNNIGNGITAGDQCTISGNTVIGGVTCSGNSSVISNNNIQGGQVTGGSITGNAISSVFSTFEDMNGYTLCYFPNVDVTGNIVSNNNIINGTVQATQTVTNNVIISGNTIGSFRVFGGWADYTENNPAISTTGSPTISGNTITGGGTYTSAFIFSESSSIVPAIDLTSGSGAATITNNTIVGNSGLAINGDCYSISNNIVKGDINGSASTVFNNVVSGSLSLSSSSWNIVGNQAEGITVSSGSGSISDNSETDGKGIAVNGASATIENNYINGKGNGTTAIVNGTNVSSFAGISVTNGSVTILNNTITDNSVGIDLYASSTGTINYNNILNNNMNIILEPGMANDVNATYNWWGTTDAQAIGQLIHDYKNDFNLGSVSTSPFLTAVNSEAMPNLTPNVTLVPPTQQPTANSTSTPTPTPTFIGINSADHTNSLASKSTSPSPLPSQTVKITSLQTITIALIVFLFASSAVMVTIGVRKRMHKPA